MEDGLYPFGRRTSRHSGGACRRCACHRCRPYSLPHDGREHHHRPECARRTSQRQPSRRRIHHTRLHSRIRFCGQRLLRCGKDKRQRGRVHDSRSGFHRICALPARSRALQQFRLRYASDVGGMAHPRRRDGQRELCGRQFRGDDDIPGHFGVCPERRP